MTVEPEKWRRNLHVSRLASPGPQGRLRLGLQHFAAGVDQEPFCYGGEEYAVNLVLEGTGVYRDAEHGELPLQAGSLLLRIPGVHHVQTISPQKPWTAAYLAVPFSVYQTLALTGDLPPLSMPVLSVPLSDWLPQSIIGFVEELASQPPVKLGTTVARIQAFLIDFHRWLRGESRGEDERLFEEATRLLSDSACERTPLPELAAELHISYSRFRQLVRRRAGMSPGGYRIACRMQRARDLLAHRDCSLKEVANRLGYADVYVFTHQFTETTGISPAAYRQRFTGG